MTPEERAETLAALSAYREQMKKRLRPGFEEAVSVIQGFEAGLRPSRDELAEIRRSMELGLPAVDGLVSVLEEVERLVVLTPGTDSELDDHPKPEPTGNLPGLLRSLDTAMAGAFSLLRDVSTMLAALAQGQKVSQEQYREKQQAALEGARIIDECRQTLRQIRGEGGPS